MSNNAPLIGDGNHIDPLQDTTQRVQSGALAAAMAADGLLGARAERAAKQAEAEKQAAAAQDMKKAKDKLDEQSKKDQPTDPRAADRNQLEQGDPNNPAKTDPSYSAEDNKAAQAWFTAEEQPEGTLGRDLVMGKAEEHLRQTQPDLMKRYDHYQSEGMTPRQAMFAMMDVKDVPGSKAPSDAAMKNAATSQSQAGAQSATQTATQTMHTNMKKATAGAMR